MVDQDGAPDGAPPLGVAASWWRSVGPRAIISVTSSAVNSARTCLLPAWPDINNRATKAPSCSKKKTSCGLSRSSYLATLRHQLPFLPTSRALVEENWLNMVGASPKDWFIAESRLVHVSFSFVAILE